MKAICIFEHAWRFVESRAHVWMLDIAFETFNIILKKLSIRRRQYFWVVVHLVVL